MSARPKIVVVGSGNADLTLQLPRLPAVGETVIGSQFLRAMGGKGANQAVAAVRMGAEVTFVCRLGRDDFGQACYQAYQREGIRTEHIAWDDLAATGVALIFINNVGENMLGVAAGANMNLSVEDVLRAEADIAAADLLMIQLEIPLASDLRAAEIARRHGVPVILNPAPPGHLPGELLEKVDYLTPNETELDFLLNEIAGQHASREAAFAWLTGHVPTLIVTQGAQGCRVLRGGGDEHYPAFPVQAVDTTAAGDSFNGGLAVSLARGLTLPEAVRFASAAGALAVTKLGAMNSHPTLSEVETFLGRQAGG